MKSCTNTVTVNSTAEPVNSSATSLSLITAETALTMVYEAGLLPLIEASS